jgi:glutamyl-tRNA reductase
VSVVVVGINHHSAPLRVLEAVAVGEHDLPKALHDLVSREHLSEAVVVSTCMRTEVYASATRFHGAQHDIRNFFADWSGMAPEAMSDFVYDYYDETAARHLLRVAAGLDSAILGEGEILRQVKTAWEAARVPRATGPTLSLLFRHAIETGKRVRFETAIARGTTSLSHTAVSLAGSVGFPLSAIPPEASGCPVIGHGPARVASASAAETIDAPWTGSEGSGAPCSWSSLLAGRSILVIGAGEMGAAIAALVAGAPDAGPLLIANRTPARAEALASRLGAAVVGWDAIPDALAQADIVMISTSSGRVVIDAEAVAAAMATRPQRPLVVVDLSLPRNVASGVGTLPGVVLFDVSHLKAHAEAAMQARRREIPAAERIIADELVRLTRATSQREAAPVVTALMARGEAIRVAELARLESRLGDLDGRQRRAVEALTRGIVAKLLHEPAVNLKAAAGEGDGDGLLAAVDQLFELSAEDR